MSRYQPLAAEVLDAIAALGFDVYQNPQPQWRTYLFFTDGTRIGYLQRGDWGGLSLSTVHIPNRTTGTGYRMTDDSEPPLMLTRAALEKAFARGPHWAYASELQTVQKWANMAAFLKSRTASLELVREGVAK